MSSANVRINTVVKSRDEHFQHGWHPEIFVVPKRKKKFNNRKNNKEFNFQKKVRHSPGNIYHLAFLPCCLAKKY